MWTRHHKQKKTGMFIVPALACAFLAYFGYHAFQGEYGMHSKYRLEERATALRGELDQLTNQRRALEERVRLVSDGTIERDMLDEQARRALDLVRADEVVIQLDD